MVRECIHRLRRAGEPITIFQTASGYVHLDDVKDPAMKASIVKAHRERTRSYMGDHAALMRQIGRMTAAEVAMQGLFDMLIPDEASTRDTRPSTMADVARLPVQYRKNVTNLLVQLLDGIATDPEAFRYEQAILADKFGGVFLTKEKAAKLAAARKALEDVGV